MATQIRVVLAEDNALLREGISRLIDGHEDLMLAGVAADLPELVDLIETCSPDVVVTDIRMPPTGTDEGLQAAALLREHHPEVGVVLLSQYTAAVLVSLSATVLSGSRQRRRDLAVLKALGLTRRQVRGIIAWQTTTVLVIAVVLGLLLGLATGRRAWSSFAASIGVVPVVVIPLAALALGLVALVVAGNALTAAPASVAARTSTATILRAE